jgi:hypothetical protein
MTFTTSGGRQVHARTSNEGDKQPQSCRVGEPFTTKQKVCGRDIHLQQIYHEVNDCFLMILMEHIRNGPSAATRLQRREVNDVTGKEVEEAHDKSPLTHHYHALQYCIRT